MLPPAEGRRRAAIVCVLILLGAETVSLRARELRGRWGGLRTFSTMTRDAARLGGSGFAFDRRLGAFLRGVASATPPGATIALSVATEEGDPATYAAAYYLAPRRVVGPGRWREADFAALFSVNPGGTSERRGARSGAIAVPFGELARLR